MLLSMMPMFFNDLTQIYLIKILYHSTVIFFIYLEVFISEIHNEEAKCMYD